jgi:hypothetical protein
VNAAVGNAEMQKSNGHYKWPSKDNKKELMTHSSASFADRLLQANNYRLDHNMSWVEINHMHCQSN